MKDIQDKVDQWIKKYGVRYFSELTNMTLLTEEVGELAKLMARIYGEQSFKEGKETSSSKERIADEMADIIFVVSCMANQMDINLDEAIERNFVKKTNRDKLRHKQNKKL